MSTAARIDELRKKFEENPRRYFAPLANELRKAGNLSEAIALCREFLPKQPEHMSGYIVFGQALYESGDLSEARTVFEQALALDPENLKALRHLGDIAKWEGDTAGARRWYERVLEADPRNDDIAAQLATLTTPVYVVPVVPEPEPEPAAPPTSPFFTPPTAAQPISPVFTPPFSMAPIGLGAIPTPDAALRAVDFDEINARLREPELLPSEVAEPVAPAVASVVREPELLDLDAIEAAGGETEPLEAAVIDTHDEDPTIVEDETIVEAGIDVGPESVQEAEPALVAEVAGDDPFGFSEAAATEVPFEEGLIAPDWPDTSALVARIATPRSVTPSFVSVLPPDAVEAFGAEPGDRVSPYALDADTMPGDLLDSAPGHADLHSALDATETDIVAATTAETAADSDAAEFDDAVSPATGDWADEQIEARVEARVEAPGEAPGEATGEVETEPDDQIEDNDEIDEAEPEWIIASAPVMTHEVTDELPWLAPAPERDAVVDDEIDSVAEAVTPVDDVVETATGRPDAIPEVARLFGDQPPDSAETEDDAELVESSFADVMPEEHNPAFVTETMGELLVSQGFTARAISVYEELVRRRPYDPVLTSRLSELQQRLAEESAPVDPSSSSPAFPTPAVGTPAFVSSVTPPFATPRFATPLTMTPLSATPISSPALAAAGVAEEPMERVTARDRFARLASRRVPRRTPPRASVAVETPADGLAALFGGDTPIHDDLAARALADAFAPIDEISHFGGALPFEEAMLGGAARMATPMRSATPIATAALTDAGGPFSFDRFFPDPATSSSPQHTPTHSSSHTPVPSPMETSARETEQHAPPATVSDDLAQFSAWLKGLGNT